MFICVTEFSANAAEGCFQVQCESKRMGCCGFMTVVCCGAMSRIDLSLVIFYLTCPVQTGCVKVLDALLCCNTFYTKEESDIFLLLRCVFDFN